MKRILIDTDILIDFTKGHDRRLGELLIDQANGKAELCVSPVTVAEFFTDTQLSNVSKQKKAREFITNFSVVDITKAIGFSAGTLLRTRKTMFLGDALIAATCLVATIPLATRNKKDFQLIDGITLL